MNLSEKVLDVVGSDEAVSNRQVRELFPYDSVIVGFFDAVGNRVCRDNKSYSDVDFPEEEAVFSKELFDRYVRDCKEFERLVRDSGSMDIGSKLPFNDPLRDLGKGFFDYLYSTDPQAVWPWHLFGKKEAGKILKIAKKFKRVPIEVDRSSTEAEVLVSISGTSTSSRQRRES